VIVHNSLDQSHHDVLGNCSDALIPLMDLAKKGISCHGMIRIHDFTDPRPL